MLPDLPVTCGKLQNGNHCFTQTRSTIKNHRGILPSYLLLNLTNLFPVDVRIRLLNDLWPARQVTFFSNNILEWIYFVQWYTHAKNGSHNFDVINLLNYWDLPPAKCASSLYASKASANPFFHVSLWKTLSFPFLCLRDLMWNRLILLTFSPSSSLQAIQNRFPAEMLKNLLENSCTRGAGETDFGSASILLVCG